MHDMTKDQPAHTEWSVLFNPQKIKDTGSHLTLSANEEERKDLARRFDLLGLDKLEAQLVVHNAKGGRVHVTGDFQAELSQSCVISGDPVASAIEDQLEGWFADPEHIVSLHKARREKAIKDGNELPILEEEDDPEPFTNGQIDLGELVAQNLSLAIPTYPRAPEAEFSGLSTQASAEHEKAFQNPFAALKDWKKQSNEES